MSTLINGMSLAAHVDFAVVNLLVSVVLVGLAWLRHIRPGIGTIVQPVVVGGTVSVILRLVEEPSGLGARIGLLTVSFGLLAVGVAGYLGWLLGADIGTGTILVVAGLGTSSVS